MSVEQTQRRQADLCASNSLAHCESRFHRLYMHGDLGASSSWHHVGFAGTGHPCKPLACMAAARSFEQQTLDAFGFGEAVLGAE